MKRFIAAALLAISLTGCDEAVRGQAHPVLYNKPIAQEPTVDGPADILESFSPRAGDPRFTLVVLKYGGKRHVFLLHTTKYDGSPPRPSESMVKVGEYPLED